MINIDNIKSFSANVGFSFIDLVTGERLSYNGDRGLEAASMIKLTVMAEFFRQTEAGLLDPFGTHIVYDNEKLPSCGAISYMSDEVEVSYIDLCTLMIILSDNTATNILIRRLGMDNINNTIRAYGLKSTSLNRLLWDSQAAALGIQNYISADDCAHIFELIYKGKLISRSASESMLRMLTHQRLNGKIPFFLHSYANVDIAHKTGEDNGITHDAGIILSEHPFILCFLSNNADVPLFERLIQDKTYEIYKELNT